MLKRQPIHKGINLITSLFPCFEEKIMFLFQCDENFQDLCHDYLLCDSKILELKEGSNTVLQHLEEYEDLKRSLHNEIEQIINK